jgi:AcrR family transcriptional regulator
VSRPPDVERRRALLAAVVDTCADHGLGQRSLRDIAERVGTSHRMLLHHFGSREGLLVAVVEEIEARQVAIAASVGPDPEALLARMWAHLSAPELRPAERLFFESYARGASGEAPFDRLLPGAVDAWLDPAATGAPGPDPDPALTRLALAVVRGLLLDLVGTGAQAATTAALARFAAMVAREQAAAPTA